jgi:hypothetical protein
MAFKDEALDTFYIAVMGRICAELVCQAIHKLFDAIMFRAVQRSFPQKL